MENKHWNKFLKVFGVVVAIFALLYFVSQNTFYQLLSLIAIIAVPLIGIALIISPFFIVKKKIKKLDGIGILIASVCSFVMIFVVIKGIELLLDLMFKGVGEGFLQSF